MLLELRRSSAFLAGLASFLFGHVAYLIAFVTQEPSWVAAAVTALLLGGLGVVVAVWLDPHLSSTLRIPVRVYIVVIVAMTAAGAGLWSLRPLATAGALAFFASDLAVARDRFVRASFANKAWGLPLYYLGQVLIAWSI